MGPKWNIARPVGAIQISRVAGIRARQIAVLVCALACVSCSGDTKPRWSRLPEADAIISQAMNSSDVGQKGIGSTSASATQLPEGHPPVTDVRPVAPSAVAPFGTSNAAPAIVRDDKLIAGGIRFEIDRSWKQRPPSSGMRLAEFTLPGEAGDAELVLFSFGAGQGGNSDSNIKRWAGQFEPDADTSFTSGPEVAELEKGALKIRLIKTSGTYNPGMMSPASGAAGSSKPNFAMVAAVIEGAPAGSIFVKATGPRGTLGKHLATLERFIRSAETEK